jgi:transcriptional regulator with XRE-family HTH domain
MLAQYTDTVFSGKWLYTTPDIPWPFRVGDNMPMGYAENMKAIRKQRGMTQQQLAEMLGVEQPTVLRYEKGRSPTIAQAQDIADALGVPLAELVSDGEVMSAGPKLKVKGEVAAGIWKDAIESPPDEWREYTGRPDCTADARHRFGLRVVGESMNEIYPHGTILDCVSVFGHTEIEPGKRVIVVRKRDDGEFEATVKEFYVDAEGKPWLRPRSTHPDFQAWAPLDGEEPGIIERVITAVVVGSNRPE